MTQNSKSIVVKIFRFALLGIFILLPIMLIILPSDYFDTGQSISIFEIVGFENYYSKGMTRAVMHLIHLDFKIAWDYNKLAFIVFPLISLVWMHYFLRHLYKVNKAYFPVNELSVQINNKISKYLKFTSGFNPGNKIKKSKD